MKEIMLVLFFVWVAFWTGKVASDTDNKAQKKIERIINEEEPCL